MHASLIFIYGRNEYLSAPLYIHRHELIHSAFKGGRIRIRSRALRPDSSFPCYIEGMVYDYGEHIEGIAELVDAENGPAAMYRL